MHVVYLKCWIVGQLPTWVWFAGVGVRSIVEGHRTAAFGHTLRHPLFSSVEVTLGYTMAVVPISG